VTCFQDWKFPSVLPLVSGRAFTRLIILHELLLNHDSSKPSKSAAEELLHLEAKEGADPTRPVWTAGNRVGSSSGPKEEREVRSRRLLNTGCAKLSEVRWPKATCAAAKRARAVTLVSVPV
jgi:hypothetical protein